MASTRGTDEIYQDIMQEINDQYGDFPNAEALADEIFDYIVNEDQWYTPIEEIVSSAFDQPPQEPEFNFDDFGDGSNFRIGAAYKGVRHIAEFETDTMYCPSDSYCLFKCYEKYIEMEGLPSNNLPKGTKIKFSRSGINQYHNTKTKYDEVIKQTLWPQQENEKEVKYRVRARAEYYKLPAVVYIELSPKNDKSVVISRRVDNNHLIRNCPNYRVGLLRIDKNSYHAVLLKQTKKLERNMFKLQYTDKLDIINDWIKFRSPDIKSRSDLAIIYDIETSAVKKNITVGKGTKAEKILNVECLVPFALAYTIVSLNQKKVITDTFEVIRDVDHDNPDYESKSNLYDKWFVDMRVRCADLFKDLKKIQVWAHNGAKFDNIFVKTAKNVTFTSQIKSGSNYKLIKCYHNENPEFIFEFKDTLPFCLSGLKNVAKILKCTPKMDFDIKGWTVADYERGYKVISEQKSLVVSPESGGNGDSIQSNEQFSAQMSTVGVSRGCDGASRLGVYPQINWRKYMRQDVDTLAEVFIKLESMYNKLGTSLSSNIGLASAAFEIMCKTCYSLSHKQYLPKDPSIIELVRSAMYGGRVIAFKRYFNSSLVGDLLICLDANSLYPSAMAIGTYPVGHPEKILSDEEAYSIYDKADKDGKKEPFLITNDKMCNSLQKDKVSNYKSTLAPHYILTIKFSIPNIPQTIVPYKENGRMLYPTNGVYEGTYNDVDIREMLIDGYTILEVVNGIYWRKSERIFTNLIEYLYNQRSILKKAGDSMEYVYKILINAMYGKLMETIDSSSYFIHQDVDVPKSFVGISKKLENGQEELSMGIKNPIIRKPIHLATYVTAYSRAIMNEYIRKIGIENIYYTDTDSLYVTKSALEKSGVVTSTVLGGVKNDYGEDVYISEAYFLDQKRYFLQKIDNKKNAEDKYPISCKYVGLTFRNLFGGIRVSDAGELKPTDEQKQKIRGIYEDILKNYEDYILDVRSNKDKFRKTLRLVSEKWKRVADSVTIIYDEIQYVIDPHKKGLYLPSEKYNHEYFGLGFDVNAAIVPLSEPAEQSVKEYCANYKLCVCNVRRIQTEIDDAGNQSVKGTPEFINTQRIKQMNPNDLKLHTLHNTRLVVNSVMPLTSPQMKQVGVGYNCRVNKQDCGEKLSVSYYVYIDKTTGVKSVVYKKDVELKVADETKTAVMELIKNGKAVLIETSKYCKVYVVDSVNETEVSVSQKKYKTVTVGIRTDLYQCGYKFYNTCVLGPTVEIRFTKEQEDELYPLIGVSEDYGYLKNTETAISGYCKTGVTSLYNELAKIKNELYRV